MVDLDLDLDRPAPAASLTERTRAAIDFIGLGRLVASALSVGVVALGGWWLVRSPVPPVERSLPFAGAAAASSPPASSGEVPTSSPPPTSPSVMVVQAAGAVVAPGVYQLPAGARLHELIAAAGGALPGADPGALPLASELSDGQRVYVPLLGEAVPASPSGPAGGAVTAAAGPIDLNRATAAELDGLPGVGPATAQAIVAHREANGPFATVDALLDVRGIGPAKLEGLRPLVSV